jgi:hypothetical protein
LTSFPKKNFVHARGHHERDQDATFTPANWSELLPGDSVVLIGNEAQRAAGTVDVVSHDGALAWIMLRPGNERRLFLREEVFRTEVDLKDLERRKKVPPAPFAWNAD